MKILCLLTIIIFNQLNVLANYKEKETYSFVNKRGKHIAKVIFRTGKFNPAEHKISHLKKKDEVPIIRIDGKYPLGTDNSLPNKEIKSLTFYFDGKKIEVPKQLYGDCYHPNFEDYLFAIRIGDDLESLFVFMAGSDAAGSYNVVWVLRKDGHHSRFSGECSDCRFIDFDSGFFKLEQ